MCHRDQGKLERQYMNKWQENDPKAANENERVYPVSYFVAVILSSRQTFKGRQKPIISPLRQDLRFYFQTHGLKQGLQYLIFYHRGNKYSNSLKFIRLLTK